MTLSGSLSCIAGVLDFRNLFVGRTSFEVDPSLFLIAGVLDFRNFFVTGVSSEANTVEGISSKVDSIVSEPIASSEEEEEDTVEGTSSKFNSIA